MERHAVEQLGDHRRIALQARTAEHRRVAIAVQHDIAQGDAVGRDQSAGAAGDLHRKRLGVAGAERLHDAPGVQRLDDELTGGVEGRGVRPVREPLETTDDLGAVRRHHLAHRTLPAKRSALIDVCAMVNKLGSIPR